jgi:uncharacterized protein (TIGR02001 family)
MTHVKIIAIILTLILAINSKSLFANQNSTSNLLSDHLDISSNFGMVSNYVFRGTTQTGDRAAIQGSIELNHKKSGFYSGLWASSVNFKNNTQEDLEFDFYGGYTKELGSVNTDLGLVYYKYPGSDKNSEYDFYEAYLDLSTSYKAIDFGNTINYSPDFFGGIGDAYYYNLYASYNINNRLTLNSSIGHQGYSSSDNRSHNDWLAGIDYKINKNISANLSYTDNNIKEGESYVIAGISIDL